MMSAQDEKIRILGESAYRNYQTLSNGEVGATDMKLKGSGNKACIGVLLCILSGFFQIGGNTFTKLSSMQSTPISSWQLLFVRSLVFIIVTSPLIVWRRICIFGPNDRGLRLKLIIQAVLANCLVFCYYEGMMRLPLGDYQAIVFSSPVFTMVMSAFLIKDRFGGYRALLALILIIGIIVICRPSSLFPQDSVLKMSSEDSMGIVFSLAGAIISAWVAIISRQLNTVHFCVQLIWSSIGGVIISLVAVFSYNSVPGLDLMQDWPVMIWSMTFGQSFLGLAGTVSIMVALKWVTPTKNKVLRSFQVVGSYIIQVEVFGTQAHTTDFIGAALIVLAVLGIAVEDIIVKRLRSKIPYV